VEKKQRETEGRIITDHSIPQSKKNITTEESRPVSTPSAEEKEAEEPKEVPVQLSVPERLSQLGAQIGDPLFIRIFKLSAELEIWIRVKEHRYELLQTYEICRQSGYLGPKLREGDKQGPEGFYYVSKRRLNPNSKFHLAFNIGYPNTYDRIHKRTGSALMVHGDCVSVGCFAMTDEKIEEIYELVEKALEGGQKIVRVHIFPFRMTKQKLEQYRYSKWYPFWSNLKEGYDYFEERGVPPNVEVKNLKYVFE
jgi:murein L,D-transpeptidase YafK